MSLYRKRYTRIYTVPGISATMTPSATIQALCTACALALAGCGGTPPAPVYISTPLPEIPAECEARCPAEPKLPKQDITDLGAAKDRLALKAWGRCERHYRATCAARLKVLLPKE